MEHDTGSPDLPDISQDSFSTPQLSPKEEVLQRLRWAFTRVLSADRAIHSHIESHFPKTLAAFDAVFGDIFYVLCHPAFALILALGLGVLTVTGIVENFVYVSVAIIWLALTLWIARSERIKKLSVLSRMLVVGILALSIGLACRGFVNYALGKYQEQQAKQKQEVVSSKEEPKKNSPEIIQNPPVSATSSPSPTPTPTASTPKPRAKQSKASQRKKERCSWEDILLGKC